MTKQNGVDVWPNAAIWMRDELRSKKCQGTEDFVDAFICYKQKCQLATFNLAHHSVDSDIEYRIN